MSAPISTAAKISTSWMFASTSVITGCGPRWLANPTSTAARPTKLCRIATSCGIEVISTRLATMAPITPPTPSASQSAGWAARPGVSAVTSSAIAIPVMPIVLPRRAVVCRDRPARLPMNRSPATR